MSGKMFILNSLARDDLLQKRKDEVMRLLYIGKFLELLPGRLKLMGVDEISSCIRNSMRCVKIP